MSDMKTKNNITATLAGYLPYITLALVASVAVYVRIRLLQVPLERDEGEYAYMGQLLLDGIPPYLHAYSMKLPGVSLLYALFMALFGRDPAAIHLGLLLVNGMCTGFVFLLAKRLFDRETALMAAASFAFLSLGKTVYGIFAHATHFIVLFALAGFVLLFRSIDRGRPPLLLASGLCFGLAFTMKQPAVFLILFAFLYLVWRGRIAAGPGKKVSLAGLALFSVGAMVPYALIILWVLRGGAFDNFWFWTVTYAREYAAGLTWDEGLSAFTHNFAVIYKPHLLLWLMACAGGAFLLAKKGRCSDRAFVGGFLLFSFLAVTPGLYFRWHYFILILPAVALLIGAAGSAIGDALAAAAGDDVRLRPLVPLLFLVVVGYGFYKERECFFQLTPLEVSYSTYGKSPFPAAPEIGRYLREHTSGDDRIAVIGSEPEIYFYAGRVSATGHIYTYSLMEDQPHAERMQQELIREIERSRPKYCVFVDLQFSWLVRPSSPRLIFDWFEKYARDHYEQVGVIDLFDSASFFHWDADAAKRSAIADAGIVVYRRKS
jgi:Dolichyl-phosphate-mannose-protein mannosyltransferase